MSSERRAALRLRQTELIATILSGDGYPDGFDRFRIDMTRDGLERKRAWCVALAWPLLARSLGPQFNQLFHEYAHQVPAPPPAGSTADGRLFAQFLGQKRVLTDVGRIQALSFDLHQRLRAGEVHERRGVVIRLTRLRKPAYVVCGVHLPGIGVRVIRVPLSGRRLS